MEKEENTFEQNFIHGLFRSALFVIWPELKIGQKVKFAHAEIEKIKIEIARKSRIIRGWNKEQGNKEGRNEEGRKKEKRESTVNNIFQFVKNSLSKRFRPIFDLFKDLTHLKYDKKGIQCNCGTKIILII